MPCFNPDAVPDLDDFLYEPFYQIMRQRLLADRMVQQRELDVDEAKVVAVVPEKNLAYRTVCSYRTVTSPLLVRRFPRLETVEVVMRVSLKDPEVQFSMASPADFPQIPGGGRGNCHRRRLDKVLVPLDRDTSSAVVSELHVAPDKGGRFGAPETAVGQGFYDVQA